MQEPQLVDVATLNPGKCMTCGSIKGPMVDTMVTTRFGRFYVCVDNCLRIWGALAGLGPVAELEQRLADASVASQALADQLEQQQPIVEAVLFAAEAIGAAKDSEQAQTAPAAA